MDAVKGPALTFTIRGLDCAEEVAVLKREVGPLVGGEDRLAFDILNGRMAIEPESDAVDADVIVRAVARTGMTARLWRDDETTTEQGRFWHVWGRTFTTLASGLLTLAGFLSHLWLAGSIQAALGSEGAGVAGSVPRLAQVLYGLGIVCGAWYVLPKAWRAALRLRPDMNLLMVIAVIGAALIGEWLEAATVSFLFSLSLSLESWSVGRARRAIAALMELAPATARVRGDDGTEMEVTADRVPAGTVFLVRPGEKIPLDGTVLRGMSDVNQAPITGESVPVPKAAHDTVFAGTINGNGGLEIRSTKAAEDTTLASIIRMVGQAQAKRAPSEQWVEKFARIYTPIVMGLALAMLILPPLLVGGDWQQWLYRSLVLLVIACPCALVISTPVSIVAGLAASAKNGVLIKGGVYLEAPAHLKAMAFDKTGTLTEGKPEVVAAVPLAGHSEAELLERAAALEIGSDHPLAQAIVAYATTRGVVPAAAEEFQIIQGKGAWGRIGGRLYWVGSHRYLEERGQETPDVHQRLETLSKTGRTVVVVGTEDHVCGFIALADKVRPSARQALQELRENGIEHLILLTGDNQGTAEAIARETGVDEVRAELLPEQKVAVVEALVARYGMVAMVGDGVNDAPALARATIGIAMGAAGSDAAIETADIALMSDDLGKLPWLIKHARRTLAVIRQNIFASLGVKSLFVLLTLLGHASLWAAIAADTGTSLLVILNGLRLLRVQSG